MDTQPQKKLNVLLVGDNGIDVYNYGYVDRISPEAPVPVFVPTRSEEKPGMAGNVEQNLKAFGMNVKFCYGDISYKTRLIDERSKQQLIRIDRDIGGKLADVSHLDVSNFDAIVISDYDKGAVSYELAQTLIKSGVPVFIDTKKQDLEKFNSAFVKINESEFKRSTSKNDKLIVTLGGKGAMFNGVLYNSTPAEVVDVCGAGDTFISAFVFGYLTTKQLSKSIAFANLAGGICVKHHGVYVLTKNDIDSIRSALA